MDPNQSIRSAEAGDAGSHLQFQISLLRLMAKKSLSHKMTAQKAGSRAGSPVLSPSAQVMELERLRHAQPANVSLQTRS
jgi:hypothetical protein